MSNKGKKNILHFCSPYGISSRMILLHVLVFCTVLSHSGTGPRTNESTDTHATKKAALKCMVVNNVSLSPSLRFTEKVLINPAWMGATSLCVGQNHGGPESFSGPLADLWGLCAGLGHPFGYEPFPFHPLMSPLSCFSPRAGCLSPVSFSLVVVWE